MRWASVWHTARTTMAAAPAASSVARAAPSAAPSTRFWMNEPISKNSAMFATRATHWNATSATMQRIAPGTIEMSRLSNTGSPHTAF